MVLELQLVSIGYNEEWPLWFPIALKRLFFSLEKEDATMASYIKFVIIWGVS